MKTDQPVHLRGDSWVSALAEALSVPVLGEPVSSASAERSPSERESKPGRQEFLRLPAHTRDHLMRANDQPDDAFDSQRGAQA